MPFMIEVVMKINSIKDIFTDEATDLAIDKKLVKKIIRYRHQFYNKTAEYTDFFGGGLIGYHMVRYTPTDSNVWFDEVLEVDDISIKRKIKELDTIEDSWHRASDPVNLSCLWLLYAIRDSKLLSAKEQDSAMIAVLEILHAKFLTSLMAHNFKFQANEAVVNDTFAALSKKFALKVHGSWGKLIRARSEEIISKRGIHYSTIKRFNDDAAILYLLTDVQGRLREVVKKILVVFYKIIEDGSKTLTESNFITFKGETVLKSKERAVTTYITYIHTVVPERDAFIKGALVGVLLNVMPSISSAHIYDALNYVSDNYGVANEKDIKPLIDEVMYHAIAWQRANSDVAKTGEIGNLAIKLKAVYMSSRSSDPGILRMRELAGNVVGRGVASKNATTLNSVRTGLMLYIIMRAMSMGYYS